MFRAGRSVACGDPRLTTPAMIGTAMISTAITSQPESAGSDWIGKVATRGPQPGEAWLRNHGKDWSDKVPAIVAALLALPVTSATIDGEGVVVDEPGVPDFERPRAALAERGGSQAAFLYGFDLLQLDGEDLRALSWEIRRATLTRLFAQGSPGIRLSEHDGDGATIFRHVCGLGAEGIVAKRRDRPYRSGRCADWVKAKNPDAPAATRITEQSNWG
jgi:bifunctional non-homologous end joining protein LigD